MEVGREESTRAANRPLQTRNIGIYSKHSQSIHQEDRESLLKAFLSLPLLLAAPRTRDCL